jgi:hypothetical protein
VYKIFMALDPDPDPSQFKQSDPYPDKSRIIPIILLSLLIL